MPDTKEMGADRGLAAPHGQRTFSQASILSPFDQALQRSQATSPSAWALPARTREDLLKVSTSVLIVSYWSSFLVASANAPWRFLQRGITSPLIHRFGYNLGSGLQARASLGQDAHDFESELAAGFKAVSDVFASAALVSAGVMSVGMGMGLLKRPPAFVARAGQYVPDWAVLRLFKKAYAGFDRATSGSVFTSFIGDAAHSSKGFCFTGALNSATALYTILAAKLESDHNMETIVAQMQSIDPELSRKEALEIFNATVPHMHLREAGMRSLGAVLSGAGSVSSGLANFDRYKYLDPISGFLFAGGLLAGSLPVGNLPDHKRFDREVNNRYTQQNEVSKMTVAFLSVLVSAGFLWMLNGKVPPPAFKWASGKMDNIVQAIAMWVATGLGYNALTDTPAATRSLYATNPRLREQRETAQGLREMVQVLRSSSDKGLAANEASAQASSFSSSHLSTTPLALDGSRISPAVGAANELPKKETSESGKDYASRILNAMAKRHPTASFVHYLRGSQTTSREVQTQTPQSPVFDEYLQRALSSSPTLPAAGPRPAASLARG